MRVSVVGTGRVGSTVAFALVAKGLVEDLVLANRSVRKAEGEAKDLLHASAFATRAVRIRAGWLEATDDSDIVIVCVSAPAVGEVRTRADLGLANAALFDELISELGRRSPEAVLLIVTNPVDVMTYRALILSGFEPRRVIGTGTLVDSARYRSLLSAQEGIHPDDIRAYILGEHGDTQFPALSISATGGEKLSDDAQTQSVFEEAVRTGYEVFRAKGYTNNAIALAVALIVESIVHDSRRTMPLSVYSDGYLGEHDVCLSLPVVVGKGGIVRRLRPRLSSAEQLAFHRSAEAVRQMILQVERARGK